jgi:predicted transcriptional regulator
MLDSLITSKTRIKLLLKFFLNPESKSYLRELAEEFGESTNAVRLELNRLAESGLLETTENGRTKVYQSNRKHPLFSDIQSMVRKFTGIDTLLEQVLSKLGKIDLAFITGDYARGRDSGIIDLVIVGEIDQNYLQKLIEKGESLIHRKIRFLVLNNEEFEKLKETLKIKEAIPIWGEGDKNHAL